MFHMRTESRMIRNDAFPRIQDCVTIVLYGPLRFPPRHQPPLIFVSLAGPRALRRCADYNCTGFRQRDCQRTKETNNYIRGRARSQNTPTRENQQSKTDVNAMQLTCNRSKWLEETSQ